MRIQEGPESTALMTPFLLTLNGGSADADSDSGGETAARMVRAGRLLMTGRRDSFEIESDREPLGVTFDPEGELLAYFYSKREDPKQVGIYRAMDLVAERRFAEAEASYREALRLPIAERGPIGPVPWLYNPETEAQRADARIRLALARLYLDQDREAEALGELDFIDRELDPTRTLFRVEREALRSRLDVRRGEYRSAIKRLRRTLRLAVTERRNWRALLNRIYLGSERLALTEAFALLTVAALETGRYEDMRWAHAEAVGRGADMRALKRQPPS
jgi:tetratricopeptide (TPR) repeat protein